MCISILIFLSVHICNIRIGAKYHPDPAPKINNRKFLRNISLQIRHWFRLVVGVERRCFSDGSVSKIVAREATGSKSKNKIDPGRSKECHMKKLKQGGTLWYANIFPVKQAGRFFVASEVEEVEYAATCCSAWNFFYGADKMCIFFSFSFKYNFQVKFHNIIQENN